MRLCLDLAGLGASTQAIRRIMRRHVPLVPLGRVRPIPLHHLPIVAAPSEARGVGIRVLGLRGAGAAREIPFSTYGLGFPAGSLRHAENENLPLPLRASCPPEVTSTGCRHNQPSGFCPSRQQVTQSLPLASIWVRTQARLKGGLTLTLLVVSNQNEGRPVKRVRITRLMCSRY